MDDLGSLARPPARPSARPPAAPLAALLDGLLARYREPHRHFHTEAHVLAVVSALMDASAVARLAGWYHDAVYDPTGTSNEEQSATLARADLASLGVPPATCERVASLVLVTRTHRPDPGDPDAVALCRADLGILAASPAGYAAYVAAVRAEYSHVDDAGWAAGRGAFLSGMLARDRIVPGSGPADDDPLERAARSNLTAELDGLAGPRP
jgi:predicted metal-dependent HD superfamily phosphohydrolase